MLRSRWESPGPGYNRDTSITDHHRLGGREKGGDNNEPGLKPPLQLNTIRRNKERITMLDEAKDPEQNSEELRTVNEPAPDRAEEKRVDVPQNEAPVTEDRAPDAEPTDAGTVPGDGTPTTGGTAGTTTP